MERVKTSPSQHLSRQAKGRIYHALFWRSVELHFPTFLGESMSQKSYGNSCSSTAPCSTHTSSPEHCAIRSIWCICTATWASPGAAQRRALKWYGFGPWATAELTEEQLTEELENHLGALRENLWIKCRNITGQHKMALQRATWGKGRQKLATDSSCSESEREVLPPTTEQHCFLFCSVSPQYRL